MEEFIIYGLALGVVAAFGVPLIVSILKSILPTSWAQYLSSLPQTYPTGTGMFWQVVTWGIVLGFGLYLIAQIRPVRQAIERTV